ncbi:ATP-grasp domain-containing protein [Desulfosporosinus nitroreducens]|uniref:ATP-grasp domain-containing protein n=1 Tax=Desulfosporosinus nitroreducens TaxID=2018668 RepID=A0ABT8QT19_9FIRM|nr:ATP-grasp domain-containing protein [Desulfosporosinus nitroreducens]MDO0824290.1 ATP-grasp domain-containing protein [Desulfosporosinus nitroreducens]
MKKLLLLGGSRYLLPAIKAAHELGVYVITADYLPDNAAHKYSDEYRNVSVTDKEEVLSLAKELKVEGILSYATDLGVTTAAYVAERLGLPTSPYESVALLQNKGHFREFLRENGFNAPYAKSYKKPEDSLAEAETFKFPVIVKPVDSAGSKGVRRVDSKEDLVSSAEYALTYSLTGEFIVEEFIELAGFSTDTDSFSIDGKLVFCSFNNQWFDADAINPYTPSGYMWPSSMPDNIQKELRSELQRMMSLLDMGTSIYNIETRMGTNGKAYIMECSPRAGGNRLAEILRLATGQDLIKASVKAALGMPIEDTITDPVYHGHWGEIILHSNRDGIFKELEIEESFKDKCVAEIDLWVKPGDEVHRFTGANETTGTLVLHCESEEELTQALTSVNDLVTVKLETTE